MEQNKLFRKAALEKLASPERLDVLMQVTSPVGWLALGSIGLVLAGVIVWSIFGSLPERIDAQGILMSGGGLREVTANGEGMLAHLSVKVGDTVKAGQQIAEISQGGSDDAIRAAQMKADQAQREFSMSSIDDQATIAGLRSTIAGTQSDIDRANLDLAKAKDELTRLQGQLAQGYTTRSRVQNAERDVSAQESRITGLKSSISGVNAQIRSVEQRIRARQQNVDAARLELEATMRNVATTTHVTAPADGRVIEVNKNVGDRLRPGEVLARIEPPSAALQAIVFVDAGAGKRITAGKPAQISPTTVKREEYGFLEGTVDQVGEFPVTPQGAMSVLSNSTLVQELIGSTSKIQMSTRLEPDPNAASGYRWSSAGGPPFKISSGTKVVVSIIVDQKRPISQVLPILRRTVGAG